MEQMEINIDSIVDKFRPMPKIVEQAQSLRPDGVQEFYSRWSNGNVSWWRSSETPLVLGDNASGLWKKDEVGKNLEGKSLQWNKIKQ